MKSLYICQYGEDTSDPCDSIEEAFVNLDPYDEDQSVLITDCTFYELSPSSGFKVKKAKKTIVVDTFVRK